MNVTQPRPASAAREERDKRRFVVEDGGHVAELDYDVDNGDLMLLHTEVPEALAGHGVGGRLVQAAVARAREAHETIIPWCPFTRRWLQDHPDARDNVTIDWTTTPGDRRRSTAGGARHE